MAFELAAGIVGITSLAVQPPGSAQKLHGYCHNYSTALKQLKEFDEEVKTLRVLIEDLSASQDANIGTAQAPSTPATLMHDERCRWWCLSILGNVARVIQELQQSFAKHSRRTKVKYIFKKACVEEWMEKLERAKSMLLLARQLDQGISLRRRLDALSQKSDLLAAGIVGVKQSVDAATTGIQNVGDDVAAVLTSTNVIEQDITILTSESTNSRVQQAHDMDVIQNGLHNITIHMAQHSQDVSSILADARSTQQIVAELPRHHHEFQRRMSAHSADQRSANAQMLALLQGFQQMQCNNRIEDVTDSIHRDALDTNSQMAQRSISQQASRSRCKCWKVVMVRSLYVQRVYENVMTFLHNQGLRLDAEALKNLISDARHSKFQSFGKADSQQALKLWRGVLGDMDSARSEAVVPSSDSINDCSVEYTMSRTILNGTRLAALSNRDKASCVLWWENKSLCGLEMMRDLDVDVEDPEIYHLRDLYGLDLLAVAAKKKGYYRPPSLRCSIPDSLISNAIKYDGDCLFGAVVADTSVWATPLSCFTNSACNFIIGVYGRSCGMATEKLQDWAALVQDQGIDLQFYGDHEVKQVRRAKLSSSKNGNDCWCGCKVSCRCILDIFLGINYGMKPENWHYWLRERTDKFAGYFWDLLERQERATYLAFKVIDASSRLATLYEHLQHDCSHRIPGSWQFPALASDELRPVDEVSMIQIIMNLRTWLYREETDNSRFEAFANAVESAEHDRNIAVAALRFLDVYLGGCRCAEPPDYSFCRDLDCFQPSQLEQEDLACDAEFLRKA